MELFPIAPRLLGRIASMKDKPTTEHPDAKSEKTALPANLDNLKIQLEQMAANKVQTPDELKEVAPRVGGR